MSDEVYKGSQYLSQKQRLVALALNISIFILLSITVTGKAIPFGSGQRLWLLSGIGFFFFTLLTAPWFRPPRISLVNAVTSALLLSTLDLSGIQMFGTPLNIFRCSIIGLEIIICLCAILAMAYVAADAIQYPHKKLAAVIGYRISEVLGKGELLFTPPALISILGYYQQNPEQQLWLFFGWVFMITIKPVELVFRLISEFKGVSVVTSRAEVLGDISRFDNPNIIRVALTSSEKWQPNTVAVACLPNGNQVNVLCLFTHIEESQLVGTGLCHGVPISPMEAITPGKVYRPESGTDATKIVDELCGLKGEAILVGFVVEDSNIAMIKFEVSSNNPMEEGMLVFCRQWDHTIFYQILDARTTEESFGRNPRGKHIASAAQLGCLDQQKGFVKYGWLPAMNSPVFMPKDPFKYDIISPASDEFVIGKVPGSKIAVSASFFDLHEYHTAILGVTGTGKTELAFDIIRQALSLNTKVFCVDFTNEYKARLADCNPQLLGLDQKQAEELDQKLFDVETGEYGAKEEKKRLKVFVDQIRNPIKRNVNEFLSSEGASLGIFELPEITNTKATLSATELYLSSIMEWARNNRRVRRVLIVLEEAHTIIPETMGAGFDTATQWVVGRISQIALQGRKYGVGLLIVSQRTALVSKSILSQCNTCITFSLFDKTSMDYLANVYSSAHVQTIPNLRFLEAIAYGKSIRSERPILVKLDYDETKKVASEALSGTSKGKKKV